MRNSKYLAIIVSMLGVVVILIGAVFVGLSVQKNNYITQSLREQKITLGLSAEQVAQGQVVDNAASAQVAAETLGKHLKSIAPTYGDLMAANTKTGGKYDPTNPSNLTYTQGLNLQNAMNMAVMGYGVIQATMATGLALIVLGLGVGLGGLVLVRLSQKEKETEKSAVSVSRRVAYQTE
jgi:hypothetical protein